LGLRSKYIKLILGCSGNQTIIAPVTQQELVMKTLNKLFKPYPTIVKSHYFQRALSIQNKLNSGEDYHCIGGKRLVRAKGMIRFKLGAYRLIFKREQLGYIPELLLQRKNLEHFLKRR